MAIDLSDPRATFDDIRAHVGHTLECVCYGSEDEPWNVTIKCVTCDIVLLDEDAPTNDCGNPGACAICADPCHG